jgi:hypothetical protein
LTAIFLAAGAQAGRPSDAGARRWKVEPTPNPAGADISVLSSVACVSGRACTAVGSLAATASSPTLPLAERWNGKRWRIQPTPAPQGTSDVLYGLSCPSAHACVAVGDAFQKAVRSDTPLIEAWNGKHWSVQASPTTKAPSSLYTVSCLSVRSCVAAGFSLTSASQAIVEKWDGKTWRIQAMPQPAKRAKLLGVSCSNARACTAVGYQQDSGNARPLVESWNGNKWQVEAVPLPHAGMLEAVSCTSPTACTATGSEFDTGGKTLAERWNGKVWRVERTPNPANYRGSFAAVALDGVSCTSARSCTASGDYSPGAAADYFIESWNGRSWRLQATPHPADFAHGALLGISCALTRCTAVGAYTGKVRTQVTLAMVG